MNTDSWDESIFLFKFLRSIACVEPICTAHLIEHTPFTILLCFRYQWFCHFDDDMYVNVPALGRLLRQYDPHKPYYIGRWPGEVWGAPVSGIYANVCH